MKKKICHNLLRTFPLFYFQQNVREQFPAFVMKMLFPGTKSTRDDSGDAQREAISDAQFKLN